MGSSESPGQEGTPGSEVAVAETPPASARTRAVDRLNLRRMLSAASQERPWDWRSRAGLAIVCVGLIFGFGAKYPNFLTVNNLLITLLSVTSVGVAGLGTMFLLISGNVDLSIGGQYALIGVLVGITARDTQNTVLAVTVGLAAGILIGFINGRLVRLLRISPLIVTLGMGTLLIGLGFVFSGGVSVFGFPHSFVSIGQARIGDLYLPVLIGAAVFLGFSIILLRSVLGLRIYAIGGNPTAAKLSGVNVDRYVTSLYMLNGALMGLVAIMSVAQVATASPDVGGGFELLVLTAVILGGVSFTGGSGHPFGVFVGVLTIGILDAGVIFANVASYWEQVVQGSALLIALSADQFAAYRRRQAASKARGRLDDHREELSSPTSEDESIAAAPSPRNAATASKARVVLSCHGLTKYFGAVSAVRDVSLSLMAGEILCLAGDNGAGKSTLVTMLSGALQPDEGRIEVEGRQVTLRDPGAARALGIATVYQDLALCLNLGAAENLTLGAEPRRWAKWGVLSWRDNRAALSEAKERLTQLGVNLPDYRQPLRLLSGGQRQSVAIARVAEPAVKVVILDEPTASLGYRQTRRVIGLVRSLAASGVAVVVISHDVDTIMALADRIVALRLGKVILEGRSSVITEESLIHAMAGYVPKRQSMG
jgi:ribose/xylose/arabinose/galactoside ABC-type transport system permease subunit/ABC-type branched-subunit amino acid transport system ATPase component